MVDTDLVSQIKQLQAEFDNLRALVDASNALLSKHVATLAKPTIAKTPSILVYDRTATRALDTVYQNTTGKIRIAVITVELTVANTGAGATSLNGLSQVNCLIGTANPPTISVSVPEIGVIMDGLVQIANTLVMRGQYTAVIIALPNYYYKAVSDKSGDGSTPSIQTWIEYEIGGA